MMFISSNRSSSSGPVMASPAHPGGAVGCLLGQDHCQAWHSPSHWLPDSPASNLGLAPRCRGNPRALTCHRLEILSRRYALRAGQASRNSRTLWLKVLEKCPFHLPARSRLCKWILLKVYRWDQKQRGVEEVGAEGEWVGEKQLYSVQEAGGVPKTGPSPGYRCSEPGVQEKPWRAQVGENNRRCCMILHRAASRRTGSSPRPLLLRVAKNKSQIESLTHIWHFFPFQPIYSFLVTFTLPFSFVPRTMSPLFHLNCTLEWNTKDKTHRTVIIFLGSHSPKGINSRTSTLIFHYIFTCIWDPIFNKFSSLKIIRKCNV